MAGPGGVDQETDRVVGDRLDRRDDLRCQRRELVVDQEHAVLARRNTNVAAFAFQHVDAGRDLGSLDLYGVEIALLRLSAEGEKGQQREKCLSHAASFSSSQALSGRGNPARSCAVILRLGSIFRVSRISISWRVCCAGCQAVRSSTTCRGCLPK